MGPERRRTLRYLSAVSPLLIALLSTLLLASVQPAAADGLERERELMTLTAANLAHSAGAGRIERRILAAMREVPRHRLVPEDVRADAYRDTALPIGHGATISQPAVVLMMTHWLEPEPDHVVLEVGTGSGYQAALLSRLVRQVYSVEIVPELAERAARDLAELGYANVTTRAGDGYLGWPEQAPFDRIIVTAGIDHVPQPLLDQLRPGGIMVLPLGPSADRLELTIVRKRNDGRISRRRVAPVLFVPLTRSSS